MGDVDFFYCFFVDIGVYDFFCDVFVVGCVGDYVLVVEL